MGKRFFSLLLAAVMIFSLLPMGSFAEETAESMEFAGGNGTKEAPYLVSTKEQLNNVRNHLDAHYKMVADIVFLDEDFNENGPFYNEGKGWQPIGTSEAPFTGSFDGNNNSVSGMTITTGIEQTLSVGLFGRSNGEIKNINMSETDITVVGDSTVQSTSNDYVYLGAVVGYGSATDCDSSGKINISCISTARSCCIYAGGVVGYGSATNCSNDCTLEAYVSSGSSRYASVSIGGICGRGESIEKCTNNGVLSASSPRYNSNISVGGIAGTAIKATNCANKARVAASGSSSNSSVYVGGICGIGGAGLLLSQCYNIGKIDGSYGTSSGGVVGYLGGSGSIKDSFNAGMVNGGWCGGILGRAFNAVAISNCYNTGIINDGNSNAIYNGGTNNYAITNCYSLEGTANTGSYAKSCTADEMTLKSTYVGFDFDEIWQIGVSEAYLWPELKAIPIGNSIVNINECNVTLDKTEVQYHTLQPEITVTYKGKELVIGQDYIVKFTVGEDSWICDSPFGRFVGGGIGAATISVIGLGVYNGVKTVGFEVIKYDMSNAFLMTPWKPESYGGQSSTSFDMQDFTYDGTEKKQSGFRVCDDNDTISSDHYIVSYKNNVDVGTATMIITGVGEYYTGTLKKQFEIYPGAITITNQPTNLTAKSGTTGKFSITATGNGLTYQWQYQTKGSSTWTNSTAASAKKATFSVSVREAINGYKYRCIVKDANGNSVTSSAATLTVTPNITKQPTNLKAKSGTTGKISITASGDGLTYQWQYQKTGGSWTNSTASSAKTAMLSVNVRSAINGYKYRCKVTNSCGNSVTSSTVTLTVTPNITKQPTALKAKSGTTGKFSVTADGVGLTYQWQYQKPGGSWTNSTAASGKKATFSVSVREAINGYKYRCVIKDANGNSVTSSAVTLTVTPNITKQPTNLTAKSGTTGKFSITAKGDGLTYQWQYQKTGSSTWTNSTASSAKKATFSVSARSAINGYKYRCIVKNSCGNTVTSSVVKLTVK